MTNSQSQMRAYLKYLLLFFVVASTVAKRDDEDDYDDEEEESWSTSNAAPPTRMLHVKMPNSKPQKDEGGIHQSNLSDSNPGLCQI